MTPAELAALLGVGRSTVNRWVSGLPYRGRRTDGRPARVYRLEDVIARLEGMTVDNSEHVAKLRALVPEGV